MSLNFQSDICMIYAGFVTESGVEVVQEGAIKDFFSKIFATIKNLIMKFINFIKNLFTKFTNFIKEKVGGLKTKQKKARETINNDEFWDDDIFDADEEEIERVSGEVEDIRRSNGTVGIEQKYQTKAITNKRNKSPRVKGDIIYNIKYKDYVSLVNNVKINSNNFDAITDAADDMKNSYEIFAPALDAVRRNDQKKIDEVGKKVFGSYKATKRITLTGQADIRRASKLISDFGFSGIDALSYSESFDNVSELVKKIRDIRNQAKDILIHEKMEKNSANKIMDKVDVMIKELDRVSSLVKSNSEIINNKFKSALQLISKTEKDMQKYSDIDISKLTSSSDQHKADFDWTIGDLFAGFKEDVKTNTKRITDLSTAYNAIFSEIIFITTRGYNEANKIIHMVCSPNAIEAV